METRRTLNCSELETHRPATHRPETIPPSSLLPVRGGMGQMPRGMTAAYRLQAENARQDRRRRAQTASLPLLLLLLPAGWLVTGCEQATTSPKPPSSAVDQLAAAQTPSAPSDAADQSPPFPASTRPVKTVDSHETWDAVYMGDSKVGFIRTLLETVDADGTRWLKGSSWQELDIRRDGQSSKITSYVRSWEDDAERLHSFRSEIVIGPSPIVVEGTCNANQLDLTVTSQGKVTRSSIPWNPANRGFFALERSLARQPMKPDEVRQLIWLMPSPAGVDVAHSTLSAQKTESVDILGQTLQLLRLQQVTRIGVATIESISWTNEAGEPLKTILPTLKQTIYRTTRERAQSKEPGGTFDLLHDSIAKVSSPLPHPHELQKAVYEVTLAHANPAHVFTSCGSQLVEPLSDRLARITVLAVRPDRATTGADQSSPTPADLAPNNWIQSDDSEIQAAAQQVAGSIAGVWDKCLALERWVQQAVHSTYTGQQLATAADVIRTRKGDCTEHAMLLVALCRAQKIPARAVLGLVYSISDQGFAFHMWTEAWVDSRWIPLDATLGSGGIGAAHIKIRDTSFEGAASTSAMLSILQVINQLKIRVVAYEPSEPGTAKP